MAGEGGNLQLFRVDRRQVLMDDFIGQQQVAGDRQPHAFAVAGSDERPRQPHRIVFRAGKGENAWVQRNRPHQRVEAVRRCRAGHPLAGILAVTGGDGDVLPGLLPAGKGDLQGRWRRQNFDTVMPELAQQIAGNAMTERVASGQHGHRFPFGPRGVNPRRALGQRTVHVAGFGRRQLCLDQFQCAADTDDQPGGRERLAGGIGQAGPAVVENADDEYFGAHSASSSSTRQMKLPSKSQTSTAR